MLKFKQTKCKIFCTRNLCLLLILALFASCGAPTDNGSDTGVDGITCGEDGVFRFMGLDYDSDKEILFNTIGASEDELTPGFLGYQTDAELCGAEFAAIHTVADDRYKQTSFRKNYESYDALKPDMDSIISAFSEAFGEPSRDNRAESGQTTEVIWGDTGLYTSSDGSRMPYSTLKVTAMDGALIVTVMPAPKPEN